MGSTNTQGYGARLKQAVNAGRIVPFIGVYDAFSASIAARYFDAVFLSGFSFAASYYGLPDIGFIAWSDIVAFSQRVRTILPSHHILVDIDDGYCDTEVACHVVTLLERAGASAVVMEDQQRPRRCGHLDGKQIMELDQFMPKLSAVLDTRKSLFVVARTDASEPDEAFKRAKAFASAGADAILLEAVKELDLISEIRSATGSAMVFNQISGGKSPPASLTQLQQAGVSLVNYSTPCLFAAQAAIEGALIDLRDRDGKLPIAQGGHVDIQSCNRLLHENLSMRSSR